MKLIYFQFKLFIFVVYLFLCFQNKITDEHDPNNFLPVEKRRPDIFTEEEYCNICEKVVLTAVKELNGKKSEMDIVDIIDLIFNQGNLSDYIPKSHLIYAEHFISNFEDELIESLKARADDTDAVYKYCIEGSQVNTLFKITNLN